MLRLIALDACRKVDLDQAVRSCQVVGNGRAFSLLLKMHEHVNRTEAQIFKRTQAFEKTLRLGGRFAQHSAVGCVSRVCQSACCKTILGDMATGAASSFAVSQMADFAPSQMGAQSAFYPDASLMPWDASDLPEIGEVKKAPPGPAAARRRQWAQPNGLP